MKEFCLSYCDDNGWEKDADKMKIDVSFPPRTLKQIVWKNSKILHIVKPLIVRVKCKECETMGKEWVLGIWREIF